jgi:hypothetical protein
LASCQHLTLHAATNIQLVLCNIPQDCQHLDKLEIYQNIKITTAVTKGVQRLISLNILGKFYYQKDATILIRLMTKFGKYLKQRKYYLQIQQTKNPAYNHNYR